MPTGCIPPRRAENRDRLSGPAHPTGPAAHPARMGPEHPDRGLSCSGTGFPVHAISSTWPRCRYTVAREIPRAVAITVALSPLARRAKAAASLSGPVTVVNAQHRRVVVGSPASHIRSFSAQRLTRALAQHDHRGLLQALRTSRDLPGRSHSSASIPLRRGSWRRDYRCLSFSGGDDVAARGPEGGAVLVVVFKDSQQLLPRCVGLTGTFEHLEAGDGHGVAGAFRRRGRPRARLR